MKVFPIENIPSIKSYLRRGQRMLLKTLPYRGFEHREDPLYRVSQEQVDNAITMLNDLPAKA